VKYKFGFKFPQEAIMIVIMFSSAYFFIKFIMTRWSIQKTFFEYNPYIEYELIAIVIYLLLTSFYVKRV